MRSLLPLAAVVLWVLPAGCGGSPAPIPIGPSIACPSEVTRESLDGRPVAVAYDLPIAAGGTGSIVVACNPAPGAAFPVGSTSVTCTATDARGLSASCGFTVRVTAVPRLAATRFLAFGDSLTEGTMSPSPTVLLVSVPDSYPTELQMLLAARYRAQAPEVLNDGIASEQVDGSSIHSPHGGRQRLPISLEMHRPEVLLLMEGTNDLIVGDFDGDLEAGADAALDGLEDMIRFARGRGVRVFLATIPPMRPGGSKYNPRVGAYIPAFNQAIRDITVAEGATLVDVHAALRDRLDLLGADGLHPTPQGYDVMAQTWFDAIKAALEAPAPSAIR